MKKNLPIALAAGIFLFTVCASAQDSTVQQAVPATEPTVSPEPANSGNADAGIDTIMTQDGKKAIADLTRSDILNMTYDDLINMPFEALMLLADKLEISVEELLNMKMTVASKSGGTLREQPGILSVITGEEIRRSGARDLIDVLRLAPGFYFGLDVNGVTGIGMRGNWGHEGKILLLMDGQEMNDLTYYIYPYGNHFPVDQIKRIEIIRGPGSALYGGAAELGVINIITKSGEDINGFSGSITLGRYQDMFGRIARKNADGEDIELFDLPRSAVTLSIGEKTKDLEFALHGSAAIAQRSDKKFTSFYFEGYDYAQDRPSIDMAKDKQAELPSANINLGIKWRDFSGRFIYDFYKTWGVDAAIYDNVYYHWFCELKYDIKLLGDKLIVTPKYNLRKNLAWWGVLDIGNIDYMRNIGNVSFLYTPQDWLKFTGGIEGYYDYYRYIFQGEGYSDAAGDSVDNTFWNKKPDIDFQNIAGFLEATYHAPWGMNVTAGGRGEYHTQYGTAFAPRLGITQIINDLHFKLLLSKAYRTPTIGALVLPFDPSTAEDPQLEPEETWVQELEAGYRINKNMFVTANFFNIILNNSIGYFDIMSKLGANPWGYKNVEAKTGSWGAECEFSYRQKSVNLTANYSFYSNAGKEAVTVSLLDSTLDTINYSFVYDTTNRIQFNVPGKKGPYLGAPQHKIGLNTSFNIWRNLWIAPTAVLMSTTYGYTSIKFDTVADNPATEYDETNILGTPVLDSIPFTILFNLFITYEDLGVKGLNVSAGVYDLFGAEYPFIQGYNGYGSPIKGPSREFLLKLTYDFKLKK
jgi:outer membrane receptor protein involved in Fe transport